MNTKKKHTGCRPPKLHSLLNVNTWYTCRKIWFYQRSGQHGAWVGNVMEANQTNWLNVKEIEHILLMNVFQSTRPTALCFVCPWDFDDDKRFLIIAAHWWCFNLTTVCMLCVIFAPFYSQGLTCIPVWISNNIRYKMWDWNYLYIAKLQGVHRWSYIIPSRTLLGMWLFIHAGIKVKPF